MEVTQGNVIGGKSADISSVSGNMSSNNDILKSVNLDTLTVDQQKVVLDMIKKESNVFSGNEYKVGNIQDLSHSHHIHHQLFVSKKEMVPLDFVLITVS